MSVDCPLGFFWDLENIQVPSGKSALAVVGALRSKLGHAGGEVEFVAVCDVTKEKVSVINELNYAQVCVVHVSAESKNAADEKLKSYLRKFAHTYKAPGTVIIVSGDINFAPDLKELRFRFGFNVILVHGSLVSDALLATAVDHYDFRQIVADLTESPVKQKTNVLRSCQLQVRNLPLHIDEQRIKVRLRQISDNCGGRVVSVNKAARVAVLRFPNPDATDRARKRMGDADVFGERIAVDPVVEGSSSARGAVSSKQESKQDSDASDDKKMRQSRGKSPHSNKMQKMNNDLPMKPLSEDVDRTIRAQQIYYVFLHHPDMEYKVSHFRREMELAFGCSLELYATLAAFPDIIELVKVTPYRSLVRLTALQRFALRSRLVLLTLGGQDVPVVVFQRAYEQRFNEPINAEAFGFHALLGLIRAVSHVLYIKGRGVTATITINRIFLAGLQATKSDIMMPLSDLCDEMSSPPPHPMTITRVFSRPPPPMAPRFLRDKMSTDRRPKHMLIPDVIERKQLAQACSQRSCQLQVRNLPTHVDEQRVKERLKQIAENSGGIVVSINSAARVALVRFSNEHAADCGRKQIEDADVFGVRIAVGPAVDSSNARGMSVGKQDSDAGERKKVRQSPTKSPRNNQPQKVDIIGPPLLTLSEGRQRSIRAQQIFYMFLHRPDMEFNVGHFRREMELEFDCCVELFALLAAFPGIIELVKVTPYRSLVRLTSLQRFALRSRLVLLTLGGQDVPVVVFQRAYEQRFNEPINAEAFGFHALLGLVRAVSHVIFIKGRGVTATVTVDRNFLSGLHSLKPDIMMPPGGMGESAPPPSPPPQWLTTARPFPRHPPVPPRFQQRPKSTDDRRFKHATVADVKRKQLSIVVPISPAKDSGLGSPGNSGDDYCLLDARSVVDDYSQKQLSPVAVGDDDDDDDDVMAGLPTPPLAVSLTPPMDVVYKSTTSLISQLTVDDVDVMVNLRKMMPSNVVASSASIQMSTTTTTTFRKRKSRLAIKFPESFAL